jgi:hypothetical protein
VSGGKVNPGVGAETQFKIGAQTTSVSQTVTPNIWSNFVTSIKSLFGIVETVNDFDVFLPVANQNGLETNPVTTTSKGLVDNQLI